MCEPSHSIIQFDPPQDDDNDQNPDQNSGAPTGRFAMLIGKAGKWLKKVGGMFHCSAMGKGHSETLADIDWQKKAFLLPADTKYEAHWWNRNFILDGRYKGSSVTFDRFGRLVPSQPDPERAKLAFENAKEYANLVSIGSLHALRQFIGATIDKTEFPHEYVTQFRDILNKKGQVDYDKRLKAAGLYGQTIYRDDNKLSLGVCETVKRICLGLTRKRHLLVPEWADDAKLWIPPTSKLVIATA